MQLEIELTYDHPKIVGKNAKQLQNIESVIMDELEKGYSAFPTCI